MVKVVTTFALNGISGIPVSVEATHNGSAAEPRTNIIGLPDTAVKEALGRVQSAAKASGISLYGGSNTVNLAPADVRKEGSSFDLPILLSLIDHTKHGGFDTSGKCFAGELSLTGELRGITGALSMALSARNNGYKEIYLPEINAAEASAAEGISVFPVKSVAQLYAHLTGVSKIQPTKFNPELFEAECLMDVLDFADVKGQDSAKRALEIAAAGIHNVLMIGPPGSGKSMLAARIPSILPPLTVSQSIETTQIHSVAGIMPAYSQLITKRPFRSPHHSISVAGLAGGGKTPKPGEISLAHNGVLFLDELPEFDRSATEILRQPIEEHTINITRVAGTVSYPSSFILVCAMNPCRCGYYGHPTRQCSCTDASRRSYVSKLSGPLLDRIDIQLEIPPLDFSELSQREFSESSAEIRKRVLAAREFAKQRFGSADMANGYMKAADVRKYCVLDDAGTRLMQAAFDTLSLSARSYDRILRVARTAADFDASDDIKPRHLALALQLRSLDSKYFN